jgi:hypothetical protein
MIIKSADDKQLQIEALQNLLSHPNANTITKKRIEQEIRNIQAGIRGEDEAAYEMKVHYGDSKNWMILNDLRIEHGDLICQIDHLIINRWLDMWVCESKHFSEGIAINEHGEFLAFFGNKPYGVPSPVEQNNKHILILQRVLDSGTIKIPKRMGFTIKPALKGLVLVSKKARITRPKTNIKSIDCIIKNDQIFNTLNKDVDDKINPLLVAKIIGQDTLLELAIEIAKIHKPIIINWPARFGLSGTTCTNELPVFVEPTLKVVPQVVVQQPVTISKHSVFKNTPLEDQPKQKKKLICHTCGKPVTYNVAKFCWFNKPKFGENIYCMDCQKKV